mmetsp:Transcript_11084/g.30985  ORF Transcript_11084/g.30985 Transcript_11084/m.30985 type:complete len:340 (+) Transcript_11084:2-1021(+)
MAMAMETTTTTTRRKIIVDTDPGVDDALTIFAALLCPEVEVIGLTTIFGNVPTAKATKNALGLLELAGRTDVPVASGSPCTFTGEEKLRIADFVHGDDGLGNTGELKPPPTATELGVSASQFIIDTAEKHPGEVIVLALGPLTNLAMALKEKPDLALHSIVCLGGAFRVNGNVNPSAEANIFCDPEAADFVFGGSVDMHVIPLDVTQRCVFSNMDLDLLEAKGGTLGKYMKDISQFYADFHKTTYNLNGLMLHDPTAFIAIVRPDLFFWKSGPIRVSCEGIAKGMTVMDMNKKVWRGPNQWSGRKHMKVALEVDEGAVVGAIRDTLLSQEPQKLYYSMK